jgi:addiction module HigA family antidote
MGVSRRLVNELCNDRRGLTTETAIMLGIAFGTSHEFWLNIQANAEAWEVHNIPRRRERIAKAHPIAACAV